MPRLIVMAMLVVLTALALPAVAESVGVDVGPASVAGTAAASGRCLGLALYDPEMDRRCCVGVYIE
jgi:hypothetical protein